ncbi:MAG: hypothetical protein JSW20_01055 [Nitrospiraceae bacterium]|nr:MAG: hypothetical protein JSW20_01055 [Nitrospiraceae bacterium]
MKSLESRTAVRSLLELGITVFIILTFALLTVVVIMLVTGTLHVFNRNFLQISFINMISTIVAVIILVLSALFLIRAFKGIRDTVINILFHDQDKQ